MSFKTTGNDSDDGYRFHLMNSKTFLASTRNCYLKVESDRRRLWIKRHCRSLTKKMNITDVLRIKTNADDPEIKRVTSCK